MRPSKSNDWMRRLMLRERKNMAEAEDKADRLVALLSEARDLIGGMPLSSRGMTLHVHVYSALTIAKDGRRS